MKDIEFITLQYIAAHGKSPRGIAMWAFAFGSCVAAPIVVEPCSYAEAKTKAARIAREVGVSSVWVCS